MTPLNDTATPNEASWQKQLFSISFSFVYSLYSLQNYLFIHNHYSNTQFLSSLYYFSLSFHVAQCVQTTQLSALPPLCRIEIAVFQSNLSHCAIIKHSKGNYEEANSKSFSFHNQQRLYYFLFSLSIITKLKYRKKEIKINLKPLEISMEVH